MGPADSPKDTGDFHSETALKLIPMRGIPASPRILAVASALNTVKSSRVAATLSSTILRAQVASWFTSPLLSQKSSTSFLPMTPPRLLNALIDASSVDFCWGNESPPAVLVAGEIDPTLIVPPADCRGATAPAETGTSSAVAATTTITATT